MKLEIAGRAVEARLEYVAAQDRLMLRTPSALLAPETAKELDIRILEATGFERELLKAVGYGYLVGAASSP